jgi:hypothetical protein
MATYTFAPRGHSDFVDQMAGKETGDWMHIRALAQSLACTVVFACFHIQNHEKTKKKQVLKSPTIHQLQIP